MRVELAHPTVRTFLRRGMVALVATRSAAGRPFLTPLWFVVHAGVVWVTTGTATRAARNVARHPDVTVLIHGETNAAEVAVRLRGRATLRPGLPPWPVLLRIAVKYYLAPRALRSEVANVARWPLRTRYYASVAGGPGHLAIVPVAAEVVARPDRPAE
ncbi:MAG TPA: pyridoxamine 5'-phosphate oxidase family protein [Candidatus Binatia bacterium]|jgi:nitroimidazol reductase NimA-like FMN-containing flavoprotein (pyridoxamine 5'-phosphate oxidase superfamily)|nr:pyridoxamine 5'-phosphate oxidase family protein [Candidatus Binatia bacterium]